MTTLADLHQAVQATLASQRLGKPVFVRYLWQGQEVPGGALADMPKLAQLTGMIGEWLGQTPSRLSVLRSQEAIRQHVTVTLQFPEGATALVSCVRGQPQPGGVDCTVIGNRGSLYFGMDAAGESIRDGSQTGFEQRREPSILAALENTLEKGTNPTAIEPGQAEPPKKTAPAQAARVTPSYGVLLVSGSHTHQENYAAAFAADPRCKIVAVTDEPGIEPRRKALNERLARAFGVPYVPDLKTALQRKDVQIVSVCAPPERRGRIAVCCAEAGKHLYMDKSLAPKLEEADAIVAAVRKAGVRSHMFSFITQGWAREAKGLLEGKSLGKLLALHADMFFAKGHTGTARLGTPRKEEYPPERHQLVEAKRELDNVGVYPVTLIRWLTGRKFRSVYGVTSNYFFKEHQQHNVEDFGLLTCTLDDGLPVTLTAGRYGWTSHPAAGMNRLVLVGSERTVVVDANRPRLEVYTDEPPWLPPDVNPEDPMGFWTSTQEAVHVRPKRTWVPIAPAGGSDAGYFLDCLDAGRESEMSAAEAALATEVLLAGYRSAATREVVTLPLAR